MTFLPVEINYIPNVLNSEQEIRFKTEPICGK